jgi:hypothetical protein
MTTNGVKEDTNLLHNLPVDIQKEIMMMVREMTLRPIRDVWIFAWKYRKEKKEICWEKKDFVLVLGDFPAWKQSRGYFNYMWAKHVMKSELRGWGLYSKAGVIEPEKIIGGAETIYCDCGKELIKITNAHIKTKKHQKWLNSH